MAKKKKSKRVSRLCHWVYDSDADMYETDCGEAFCLNEKDDKIKFCCYCGKVLSFE